MQLLSEGKLEGLLEKVLSESTEDPAGFQVDFNFTGFFVTYKTSKN